MFGAALLPGALPGSAVGFTVNGAPLPKSLALASGGAELQFASNWSLLAKFDAELASGAHSYAGNGTLRFNW
jgi:uncharacterized protein with beta-barrel porin domain